MPGRRFVDLEAAETSANSPLFTEELQNYECTTRYRRPHTPYGSTTRPHALVAAVYLQANATKSLLLEPETRSVHLDPGTALSAATDSELYPSSRYCLVLQLISVRE